jgi:hypothetical protein
MGLASTRVLADQLLAARERIQHTRGSWFLVRSEFVCGRSDGYKIDSRSLRTCRVMLCAADGDRPRSQSRSRAVECMLCLVLILPDRERPPLAALRQTHDHEIAHSPERRFQRRGWGTFAVPSSHAQHSSLSFSPLGNSRGMIRLRIIIGGEFAVGSESYSGMGFRLELGVAVFGRKTGFLRMATTFPPCWYVVC